MNIFSPNILLQICTELCGQEIDVMISYFKMKTAGNVYFIFKLLNFSVDISCAESILLI